MEAGLGMAFLPIDWSFLAPYTQSLELGFKSADLRNRWWGGARKRINQKGSEPENAITSGDSP
jgi:hypothetical protein